MCGALRDAGLAAEEVEDAETLRALPKTTPRVVLLVAVDHADDQPPHATDDAERVINVALLPRDRSSGYADALRAGWVAAVYRDAPLDLLVDVVTEALAGRTVLPHDVARDLAGGPAEESAALAAQHVEWLRFLADGHTIAALAARTQYSEREMHRRLAAVYRRLGCTTKTQALLIASQQGLL